MSTWIFSTHFSGLSKHHILNSLTNYNIYCRNVNGINSLNYPKHSSYCLVISKVNSDQPLFSSILPLPEQSSLHAQLVIVVEIWFFQALLSAFTSKRHAMFHNQVGKSLLYYFTMRFCYYNAINLLWQSWERYLSYRVSLYFRICTRINLFPADAVCN